MSSQIPDKIATAEKIGRRLFHTSDVNRARNGTGWRQFLYRGCKRLSTDRVSVGSTKELTEIACQETAARDGQFVGWAKVPVESAATGGRTVEASPTESNRYHADIVLPDCVVACKEKETRHAMELAKCASYMESTLS